MSTDPIEVLRESVKELRALLAEMDPPRKPATGGRKMDANQLRHTTGKLESALASLSCRYPDCGCRPAMGSAGATEVCPLAAPKPESAEAVDPDAYSIIDEFVQCANVGRSGGKLYRVAQDWLALADARRERTTPPHPETPNEQ